MLVATDGLKVLREHARESRTIRDGVVLLKGSEIHTDGRFSLSNPRPDGGDEIDARFRIVKRDLASLRRD